MRIPAWTTTVSVVLLAFGCGVSAGNRLGSGGAGASAGGSGGALATTSGAGGGVSITTGTTLMTTSTGAGGSSASSTSTGGASSASSGAGGVDAGPPGGDCQSDADCPGGHCVAITPGGFLVCQIPPQQATVCQSPLDQCCATMPCPGGAPCEVGPLVPLCAGTVPAPHNQCAVDQCATDADCLAGQICGLAGALGRAIRACIPAACRVNADCTAQPGGECEPVNEPCCNTVAGLYCVYPGGGCRRTSDCPAMEYCQITGDAALCQGGTPVCPL
jgi:hypothetical protein